MSTELYNEWIQSHQVQTGDFDVADSVMEKIIQKDHGYEIFQKAWELFLLDFIQDKAWARIGVVAAGALTGLLRMIWIAYYGLFV